MWPYLILNFHCIHMALQMSTAVGSLLSGARVYHISIISGWCHNLYPTCECRAESDKSPLII